VRTQRHCLAVLNTSNNETNHRLFAQHHCVLQQHTGLYGSFSMGRCSQGRGPICTTTVGWVLCHDVGKKHAPGGRQRVRIYLGSHQARAGEFFLIFGHFSLVKLDVATCVGWALPFPDSFLLPKQARTSINGIKGEKSLKETLGQSTQGHYAVRIHIRYHMPTTPSRTSG
jgi:hypothetical protein